MMKMMLPERIYMGHVNQLLMAAAKFAGAFSCIRK